MPISFPRDWPVGNRLIGVRFLPQPMAELAAQRSGRQIAKDLGPTLWAAEWQSKPLDATRLGQVRAWYDTVLSTESFYAYDQMRRYPLAYRTGWGALTVGGSPFDGVCGLADVADNLVEIDLADLPAGFVLSAGDYLSFDYGASRALHRVSAGAEADMDGLLTVEVRPAIRAGHGAGGSPLPAVSLYQAAAEMIIRPGTYQETIDNLRLAQVSFEAIQTL